MSILYLKSPISTDSSLSLSERINSDSFFRTRIVDDPVEIPLESLEWYITNSRISDAIICHLLSTSHTNSHWHNAKCSLVAGIAHGLGTPLLMLAHSPFECPLDYKLLLAVHSSAKQCQQRAEAFLLYASKQLGDRLTSVIEQKNRNNDKERLRRLSVGESVAENEEYEINSYFIVTSSFLEALRGQETIFVGRKGTGKTANLYALSSQLQSDKRNYVCVIKPVGYEVDGVLRMLRQSIPKSEKGYLVESLWKFLIYSELACHISEDLNARPAHYGFTQGERRLMAFFEENQGLLGQPFSIRLQNAVESLCDLHRYAPGHEQRSRVSELLHERIIRDLRQQLGIMLNDRNRVIVLIHNLDKSWGKGEDTDFLSQLLLGLLGVAHRISEDFRASNHWRKSVNLSLVIFLRSDIFSHVQRVSQEKDKISFTRIAWKEPDVLLRLLDSRLEYSLEEQGGAERIWRDLVVDVVDGVPARQFVALSVLPRPRDVIFLMKAAISDAVSRGHARVEAEDLLSARAKYSQYALDSLVAEDDPRIGKMESILYEFAGSKSVLSRSDVEVTIRKAGVDARFVDDYVDLLCDLNFLGIRSSNGAVELFQDESERRVRQTVARKVAEQHGLASEQYVISRPFRAVLEIEECGIGRETNMGG